MQVVFECQLPVAQTHTQLKFTAPSQYWSCLLKTSWQFKVKRALETNQINIRVNFEVVDLVTHSFIIWSLNYTTLNLKLTINDLIIALII